jgi:hypothetical protein
MLLRFDMHEDPAVRQLPASGHYYIPAGAAFAGKQKGAVDRAAPPT